MIALPPSVRIFVCTAPTDMRKGFDGLSALVETLIGEDPLSGHLFVFRNRRRDRLKILYWDTDGFWILYKRLERGTFQLPGEGSARSSSTDERSTDRQPARLEMRADELAMLLGGIDLSSAKRRRRYHRPPSRAAG